MNGELVLVGGGAEREPRGDADWEGLVEPSCQGGKEGGVICGWGVGVDPQEGDRAVGVDLSSKGEGKCAVGRAEDISREVREGGCYGVPIRVGRVYLPWCIEWAGGRGEGGVSGGRGGGGGGGGKGGDPSRGCLFGLLFRGGGGHFCVRATGADRVEVSGDELGDAGVATIGEVRGFLGVRVGLGERSGVPIADVVNGVHPREVRIQGGAII